MLLFLSLMRFKRADYLLPAYPGMAIFLGAWADRCWQKQMLARVSLTCVFIAYGIGWQVYQLGIALPSSGPVTMPSTFLWTA